MAHVLNINDNNLLLQQGDTLSRSQGYAWLKNGDVFFDFEDLNNAVAACRLEPQQINSRYWQQCEQTALPGNESGMRHAADLVWRHLSELKSRFDLEQLVLVVPSHYQAANLQLLLGIAQACELMITGLVNKAVLAAANLNPVVDRLVHIDVQLHQTVCSEVLRSQAGWRLGQVEVLHEVGLHGMQDALLRAAQERFINSDRFDPLHYAETEQQVFDQLGTWAAEIAQSGKASMRVEQSGNQHGCSIDAKQWRAALAAYEKTLIGAGSEWNPELRVFDLNGFEVLSFVGDTHVGVTQKLLPSELISPPDFKDHQGELVYLTELSATPASESLSKSEQSSKVAPEATPAPPASKKLSTPPQSANPQPHDATHVLFAGAAVSLANATVNMDAGRLTLNKTNAGNLVDALRSGQLFIVGDEGRQEVKVNDRLGSHLADGVLTVIRVE